MARFLFTHFSAYLLFKCMTKVYSIYGLCFQGYGVVLVNTDEAGTLIVTNFRLIFLVSMS